MNNETSDGGATVPCISLLAASVALKEYLEGPACTLPGFDIPDEVWRPFTDAINKENSGASLPCTDVSANASLERQEPRT
jgi:hypothetical protein